MTSSPSKGQIQHLLRRGEITTGLVQGLDGLEVRHAAGGEGRMARRPGHLGRALEGRALVSRHHHHGVVALRRRAVVQRVANCLDPAGLVGVVVRAGVLGGAEVSEALLFVESQEERALGVGWMGRVLTQYSHPATPPRLPAPVSWVMTLVSVLRDWKPEPPSPWLSSTPALMRDGSQEPLETRPVLPSA